MTPLPKRRHSTARSGKRQNGHQKITVSLVACSHCGKMITSHNVCPFCGFYRGQEILQKRNEKAKRSSS